MTAGRSTVPAVRLTSTHMNWQSWRVPWRPWSRKSSNWKVPLSQEWVTPHFNDPPPGQIILGMNDPQSFLPRNKWPPGSLTPRNQRPTPGKNDPPPPPHMHSCSQRDDSIQRGACKRSANRNCKRFTKQKLQAIKTGAGEGLGTRQRLRTFNGKFSREMAATKRSSTDFSSS